MLFVKLNINKIHFDNEKFIQNTTIGQAGKQSLTTIIKWHL